MAEIDEILWQETKENLMADGLDQDSAEIILYDMKDTGFFDLGEEPTVGRPMREEEILEHAIRIGNQVLESTDYCWVYEDEDLPEDITEEDMQEIHAKILSLSATEEIGN